MRNGGGIEVVFYVVLHTINIMKSVIMLIENEMTNANNKAAFICDKSNGNNEKGLLECLLQLKK